MKAKLTALFNRLKTIFTRKVIWQGAKDLTVVPAFVCGGIQYYEIPGVFNVPYRRGLAAADVYEEVQMRVTREYLQAHTQRVKEILSDPKSINILEINKLYSELQERINWIVSPETLYKLASIVYFDENENPYDYNYGYAIEKIKKWKKYKVEDFFLQEPIKKYIPHSELQGQDLANYIRVAMAVENKQSENLLQTLSKTNQTKDFYKTIKTLQTEISES